MAAPNNGGIDSPALVEASPVQQALQSQEPVIAACVDSVLQSISPQGWFNDERKVNRPYFTALALGQLRRLGIRQWRIGDDSRLCTIHESLNFLQSVSHEESVGRLVCDAAEIWFALKSNSAGTSFDSALERCAHVVAAGIDTDWKSDRQDYWYGGASIARCLRWAELAAKPKLAAACENALVSSWEEGKLDGHTRLHAYHLGHVTATIGNRPALRSLHDETLMELAKISQDLLTTNRQIHIDFRINSISAAYLGLRKSHVRKHKKLAAELAAWLVTGSRNQTPPVLQSPRVALSALPALLARATTRLFKVDGRHLIAADFDAAGQSQTAFAWKANSGPLVLPDATDFTPKQQIMTYLAEHKGLDRLRATPDFDPSKFTQAAIREACARSTGGVSGNLRGLVSDGFVTMEKTEVNVGQRKRQKVKCYALTLIGEKEVKQIPREAFQKSDRLGALSV